MDNMIETMIHFRYGGKIEVAVRMGDAVGMWQDCAYPNWDWSTYVYRRKLDLPSVNWSHVSEEYICLATDEDGVTNLFRHTPVLSMNCREWLTSLDYIRADAFSSFKSGTVDWKDSIVHRPKAT